MIHIERTDEVGDNIRYVVHVFNPKTGKRSFLTSCKTIEDARYFIDMKYHGAKKTLPFPSEISSQTVVEKYLYSFYRTIVCKTNIFVYISKIKEGECNEKKESNQQVSCD